MLDEEVSLGWRREWGVPINQEDLLGTLLTLTISVFHGLDRLGIPYARDEAEAYMHTWCVIGELLGIQPGLLPLQRSEGEKLANHYARRHHRSSEAGVRLTAALLGQLELAMPWGLRKLPRTLIRQMLPYEAEYLHVPRAAPWGRALAWAARLGPVLARLPGGLRLSQAPVATLGRSVVGTYIDRWSQGEDHRLRTDPVAARLLSSRWSKRRRFVRRRPHAAQQRTADGS